MSGGGAPAKPVMPDRAMLLAAGLGLRLRPLTENVPKPLVRVNGRTLIDHALDRFEEAGVGRAVVNLHHLGDVVRDHLTARHRPRVEFAWESELLETGGGVKNALPLLGEGPFFVANADALWLNGPSLALARLAQAWDGGEMDALLLLHSTVEAYGYDGRGDFVVDPGGRLHRRPEMEVAPYLFTGIEILHPRLFDGTPTGAFSLNLLFDKAIAAGRLYGIIHDGEWFHVGTTDGLEAAERFMAKRFAGVRHR